MIEPPQIVYVDSLQSIYSIWYHSPGKEGKCYQEEKNVPLGRNTLKR